MRTRQRIFFRSCVLLLLAGLWGCKVADDANAAAQQMMATSAQLSNYYGVLENSLTDTISLNELNASLFGVRFTDSDRQQIEDARTEIHKRKDLAQALTKLSSEMSALATARASADVENAATALGNKMINVKALPHGSPVPAALGKVGGYLIQIVQQHEEKKAAQAIDDTLATLTELFAKEKPIYDSLDRQHIFLAKTVAASLIKRQFVDPTSILQPALKPFGLTAASSQESLQETLRTLAGSRLEASALSVSSREADASAAMLSSLQEMSARIHQLATEKRMPLRGNPLSLKVVESWAASLI